MANTVRLAIRRMGRSPGFTLGVVLSFALGIGANATIFGIVDRLLLSPPAHVADAGRVVRLLPERLIAQTGKREIGDQLTFPDYTDLAHSRSFAGVAAVSRRKLIMGYGSEAKQVDAALVTGEFFPLLGPRPEFGRFFGIDEDRAGAPGVAVISYGMWQREFGQQSAVLTKTLNFGNGSYAIVGVAPRGFTGPDLKPVDVWLPLQTAATQMQGTMWVRNRNLNWLRLVGRLAPGVTLAGAEAEASLLHRRGRGEQIQQKKYDAKAQIIGASLIAARGPTPSSESLVTLWLAGLSLLVLLIACANVANLLLARAMMQQRETGIRLALGSSRGRVIGEALTESLMLAAIGGVAALLLALWTNGLLRGLLLPEIDWSGPAIGARVPVFVLILVILAGIMAGILPAIQASRPDVVHAMRGKSRSSSAAASRTRDGLIVLQAALSVVLLVAAGLFVRSLQRVSAIDLGFTAEGVLFISPDFVRGTPEERTIQFVRRATERLRTLREVEHVTADISIPFWSAKSVTLHVPGMDSLPVIPSGDPTLHVVDEDYFATLRLKVVRGRGIEAADNREGAPRVAVVNETMARTVWPSRNAIGQCLQIGEGAGKPGVLPCVSIIGVVANARRSTLLEGETMQYYIPEAQHLVDQSPEGLLVRVRSDQPTIILPLIRRELTSLEPALRFVDIQPLSALTDPETRSWKLGATAFGMFGILALIVAGIGLYSVLAYNVAQRTIELGIRAALGASRGGLMQLIMSEALGRVGVGLVLGMLITAAAAPRIAPLLYQVSPYDPLTLAVTGLSLLVVATVAAIVPARNATRIHPAVALRAE